MALARNEGGILAMFQVKRRSSALRKKGVPALKRAAPSVVRSNGLDRTQGRSTFYGIPFVRDAFTFTVDAALLWLNGFQAYEKMWAYIPPDRRAEIAKNCEENKGEKDYAVAHSPESQARIVHLLEVIRETESRTAAFYEQRPRLLKPGTIARLGDIDKLMKRYATYPTLALNPGSRAFAVVQEPVVPEWETLVELTEEERLETDPLKRQNYDIGPGCSYPAATAEERAVMARYAGKNVPEVTAGDRAILDAYEVRVSGSYTHKSVPAETPHGEIAAAHAIIDLARLGALHNVKKCSFCDAWFYAKRAGQVNCGQQCRKDKRKQNPEYKETQEQKKQRNKNVVEQKKLKSELKALRTRAKGKPTVDECASIEGMERKISELDLAIKASLKRAKDNQARQHRKRKALVV